MSDRGGVPLDGAADASLEATPPSNASDGNGTANQFADASDDPVAPDEGTVDAPVDVSNSAADSLASAVQVESDAGVIGVVGHNGNILAIAIAPLTLTPTFSPSTSDYYVPCAAGDNTIVLSITYASGTQMVSLDVTEGQAIVVQDQYWIRCLPHDFPTLTVTKQGNGPTPGYYLANTGGFAVVFDANGTPVWYERGSEVVNVDAPAPDTISLMPNGTAPFGRSLLSRFDIHDLDTSSVASILAVGGPTDDHELQALANGDHLLFTYPIEGGVDLSGLQSFGTNETMAACEIQEVDPAGNLVWSWRASDHIDPVKESLEPMTDSFGEGGTLVDVFHCNSIDVDGSGNLLISMRHANAVFYINRSTGQIEWKLGGSPYNKDGAATIEVVGDPETTFSTQHDARFRPNGNISMFDDHGAGQGVARCVEYAIDHTANTATVAWQYLGKGQSGYEGSCRRYADGENLVGWGYVAGDPRIVTEVDGNGNDVFDIAVSGNNPSYRAVKVPLAQLAIGPMRATAGK